MSARSGDPAGLGDQHLPKRHTAASAGRLLKHSFRWPRQVAYFVPTAIANKRLALRILWAHSFNITARIRAFICDENARLRSRL
jgi:hypothetical protein